MILGAGNISWGRLGAGDHMFSLPITPTAHLGQRAFAPLGHGSRLSHVSRADSMGYAARHSMLESQHTMGKTTSAFNTTNAFSRSGRHSTPVPSHTTTSRGTGRNSRKANWHGSEAGVSVSFEAAGSFAESKSHARGSMTNVSVDASSTVGLSAPSSMVGNESSFRSSSSSSQESESQGSVPPQLRIISLDEESGRIISAESPRGSARVLAWHPSSNGGGGMDDHSVTSEMSATSTGTIASFCEAAANTDAKRVERGHHFLLLSVRVLSSAKASKFSTLFHHRTLIPSTIVSFCPEHKATYECLCGMCGSVCQLCHTHRLDHFQTLMPIISSFVECMQSAEAAGVASQ